MTKVRDLSVEGLLPYVRAAKKAKAEYLAGLADEFEHRRAFREHNHAPVLALCGHGRAGKDLSAVYLCQLLGLKYGGSCSSVVLPLIAHTLELSVEEAWSSRHDKRDFWYRWCCALRHDDAAVLPRLLLGKGDMVVGIRDDYELFAARREGLIDYTLWIDNDRVQKDPTMTYGPEDCDIGITNFGSKSELYRKLETVASLVTGRA